MSSRWLRCSLLALAGALGSMACVLLGDFSTSQCGKDADCAALGPGLTCAGHDGVGVCLPSSQSAAPGSSSASSSSSGTGGGGGASGCTSNRDCTARNGDLPSICSSASRQCVELRSDPCPLVYGDFLKDDVVVLGGFAYLSANTPSATPAALAIRLAVDEINAAGGVPAGPDGAHHALVAVVCSKAHPEDVLPSSKRIVEELGAPAILGQIETAELKPLIDQEAVAHDVLVLATLANDATLTSAAFADQGLLWHAIGDMVTVAPAFGAALALAEERVKQAPDAGAGDIKVALVTSTSFETQALATALKPHLHYNGGKDIQQNGANFVEVQVESKYENPNASYAAQIAKLIDEAPDVILSASGDEFGVDLLPNLETGWTTTKPRPFYVACPLQRYSEFIATLYASASATLRTRFLGVDFSGDPALYEAYANRYEIAYPNAPNGVGGFNYVYDATYLLAFGIAGAGKEAPLTGSAIAKGLGKLSSGQPVVVGTSAPAPTASYSDGLGLLASEGHFQLVGTTGPFVLDAATGSRKMGASLFCIVQRDDGLNVFRFYAQAYNDASGQLEGTFDCF